MKHWLRKLIKSLAYVAAATVIVLAIAVGIFRLMLPRLPEYQEEIKNWASAAIGMQVDFSGMNARWRLSGPELSFFSAGLSHAGTGERILTADEVSVGVGLLRLVADRELVVDRVSIRGADISVAEDEGGEWLIQGVPVADLLPERNTGGDSPGDVAIVAEDIGVMYEHPGSGQLVAIDIRSISVVRGSEELRIEADIDLEEEFGDSLEISANRLVFDGADNVWRIFVEGDSLSLPGWSRLRPPGLPAVGSGRANLSFWVDVKARTVQSATANIDVVDLVTAGDEAGAALDIRGSFEYSLEPDGWLLAANELRVASPRTTWPRSDWQVRVISPDGGPVTGLRAEARYVDLDDLRLFRPWLPAGLQEELDRYTPSGILHELNLELLGIGDSDPDFNVSAELERAGIASVDGRPGMREFSGRVRADPDGGRVEIGSEGLTLDLAGELPAPLRLDSAEGTVIWRRSQTGFTILTDSVQLANPDFETRVSLQLGLPADGSPPVLDLEGNWQVFDVSAVSRYLPQRRMQDKLRAWFADALVAGRLVDGSIRFSGAVDAFPFDDGGGQFRVAARLEDATLQYSPNWPAPQFRYADITVENLHLYSHANSTVNAGNSVEDARIEIGDLRNPVVEIDALVAGTLLTLRDYAIASPIDGVLGGQLGNVAADGNASLDLSVRYPVRDKENYDFEMRLRTSDGRLTVDGFPAPLTELNGIVDISRDRIAAESLFGQFLGGPVDLRLSRTTDPEAPHSVILDASGSTTALAAQAGLGVDLKGILTGDFSYGARLSFPNGTAPEPGIFQIIVESDLYGLQLDLPAPLQKTDDESLPATIRIDFPGPGQINTSGTMAEVLNWSGQFLQHADGWDFDRGVVALGGDYPSSAPSRGLHIHGQAPALDLEAWLAVGRRGNREIALADRIRSIDLDVGRFHAVGQLFMDHKLTVNRSGLDWLIEIQGDDASGVITVPYDFASGRAMTLEMARLILPGDDVESPYEEGVADPLALPAISIVAEEFAFGQRHFGTLTADFRKTERGLESDNLVMRDETFTVQGSAGWVRDPYEESGQRTYVDAVLTSSDVQRSSRRLAYDPGVSADRMQIDLEVGWAGGPRDDFMSALNGTVGVSIGEGRLTEVDPGAGRVFGLMSFVALPRRLALDFSDVFDSGFGFDQITGNFRLTNGNAYTCDLTLTGPAADVGIVGRTGLFDRDYEQAVIVSANFGNTLPVVGLFTGGPQVAAALLVFSQLFKKPLKDVGQVYYAVDGSWDEPVIGDSSLEHFTDTSSLAGCVSASQ